MHELSLVTNLLAIIRQEMQKHGKTKLLHVRICHGALSNVVPEAMTTAFEILAVEPDVANAKITMIPIPLRLSCTSCKQEFEPENQSAAWFSPCPHCGAEGGHAVLSGKELYIDNIEVE